MAGHVPAICVGGGMPNPDICLAGSLVASLGVTPH